MPIGQYEDATEARRELDFLETFVAKSGSGLEIDSKDREALQVLIEESSAYTLKNQGDFGGPYRAPPEAFSGKLGVPIVEEELVALQQNFTQLLQASRATELGESSIAALSAYYAKEIEDRRDFLAMLKSPEEFQLARMKVQLEELKRAPSENSKKIDGLGAAITELENKIAQGKP